MNIAQEFRLGEVRLC